MKIRPAHPSEAALIKELIYELALFEKAPESAQATIEQISGAFFAERPAVFCDLIEDDQGIVVGLAIWFLNYSTWTGTHGIYLEDLFIRPEARGKGYGKAVLAHLATNVWNVVITDCNGGFWIGTKRRSSSIKA